MTVEYKDLELVMTGPKGRERLKIRGGYPKNELARWLFSQLGLMHLVVPYLPRKVICDFPVAKITRDLIGKMYRHEGRKAPKIISPSSKFKPFVLPPTKGPKRVLNSYSGGKDSMLNQCLAQDECGPNNVIAVHIGGLGKGVAAGERKASIFQAKKFGFRHFRVVELEKSSGETGAAVLRSAKIFDSGLLIPIALEFGASVVITEEPGGGPYFTGQHWTMDYFNNVFLKRAGIPIRVGWYGRPVEGAVKELIARRPTWLLYVHNCFSPLNYKINIRNSWLKRTPTFPPFEHACGSCVKCRITRLGWLLYGRHKASNTDAIKFIRSCEKWRDEKMATHRDLLVGSFSLYLGRAFERYGLKARSVA